MIIHNPFRSHVRLSCKRTLAKRYSISIQQIACESTAQASEGATFAQRHNEEEPSSNSQDERLSFRIRRTPVLDIRRSSIKHTSRNVALDKKNATTLHGHRGRKLQETVKDLDFDSLGASAKAVVLQDSKYTYYTHEQRMKDMKAEYVDIGKQLDNERGIVTPDQIYRSIDTLQPQASRAVMAWEELNEFVKVLSEGFTTSQMQTYIERFNQEKAVHGTHIIRHTSNLELTGKSTMAIRPWQPGLCKSSDAFKYDPLQGYAVSSYTSKQKVALKIIRECWNLEAVELVEGIGQFEVHLKERDLNLLAGLLDTLVNFPSKIVQESLNHHWLNYKKNI